MNAGFLEVTALGVRHGHLVAGDGSRRGGGGVGRQGEGQPQQHEACSHGWSRGLGCDPRCEGAATGACKRGRAK